MRATRSRESVERMGMSPCSSVSTPTSVAAHPRDQISVDERRSEVIGVVHAFCVASMNEIEAIELRTFFLWPLAITAIVAPIT